MTMSKLTLTVPLEIIALAEEQAKSEKTSISAMFVNFIMAKNKMSDHSHLHSVIGPLTQSLTGIIKLPDDFEEKEFLSQIFTEKYDLEK